VRVGLEEVVVICEGTEVATNTARSPIALGPAPAALAITPDGKTLYVADVVGTVTPIVTATNSAGQPIVIADAVDRGMVLAP
jgi:hyaluronoglucosaminidase